MSIHRDIPDLTGWNLRITQGGAPTIMPGNYAPDVIAQTKFVYEFAGDDDWQRRDRAWTIKARAHALHISAQHDHDAWVTADPATRGPEPVIPPDPGDPGPEPAMPANYEDYWHTALAPFVQPGGVADGADLPQVYTKAKSEHFNTVTDCQWSYQNSSAPPGGSPDSTQTTVTGSYSVINETVYNYADPSYHHYISNTSDVSGTVEDIVWHDGTKDDPPTTPKRSTDETTAYHGAAPGGVLADPMEDQDDVIEAGFRKFEWTKATHSGFTAYHTSDGPYTDESQPLSYSITREDYLTDSLEDPMTKTGLVAAAVALFGATGAPDWGADEAGGFNPASSCVVTNWPKIEDILQTPPGTTDPPAWPDASGDLGAFNLGTGIRATVTACRFKFSLPSGYTDNRTYFSAEWDVVWFPQDWLDWNDRKTAHDAWQTAHDTWEHANPATRGPEPEEPDEPGIEPTRPTVTHGGPLTLSSGSTVSDWVTLPNPAAPGRYEVRNLAVISYRSRFGQKPTFLGERWIPENVPVPH